MANLSPYKIWIRNLKVKILYSTRYFKSFDAKNKTKQKKSLFNLRRLKTRKKLLEVNHHIKIIPKRFF